MACPSYSMTYADVLGYALGISIFLNTIYLFFSYITQDYMKEKKAFSYIAEALLVALIIYTVLNLPSMLSTLTSVIGISESGICSFSDVLREEGAKLHEKLSDIQEGIKRKALLLATSLGVEVLVFNFPLASALSSLFNLQSVLTELAALYNYIEGAKIFALASSYFLANLVNLSPALLGAGIVLRAIPFLRGLGGFIIGFSLAFGLVYPLSYLILFKPPPIVDVFPKTATVWGFKTLLPLAVIRPVTISIGSFQGGIGVGEGILEGISGLILDIIISHLMALSIAIIFLRMAAIILSRSTVLVGWMSSSLARFI